MQRDTIKRLGQTLSAAVTIPLLIPFFFTTCRETILLDVHRWLEAERCNQRAGIWGLLFLLAAYKEYRTLYYYRLQRGNIFGAVLSVVLGRIYQGQVALFIRCPTIGPGLFLQHGYCTSIGAQQIGKNCWINQQVTIGYKDATVGPTLGDNVVVNVGARVLGPIHVGNNVTVGANAVVTKDVPDDCVVVGAPAYIVRRRGIKVREPLGQGPDANDTLSSSPRVLTRVQ